MRRTRRPLDPAKRVGTARRAPATRNLRTSRKLAVPESGNGPVDAIEHVRPRWGLGEALIAWISSVILSSFFFVGLLEIGDYTARAPERPGGYIGRTFGQLTSGQELRDDALPLVWQMFTLVPGWIVLLGVAWFVAGIVGHERRGWNVGREPKDVAIGIGAGLFLQVPIMVIVGILMNLILGDFAPSGRALTLIDSINSPIALIALFLAVAVGAPVVEEFFYRGIVQGALVERLGGIPGVLIASIIFGAVHLNVIEFVPLTIAGLGFGLLAWKTGRLLPAIVAHMTFNTFTLIVLLLSSTAA